MATGVKVVDDDREMDTWKRDCAYYPASRRSRIEDTGSISTTFPRDEH